MRNRIRLRMGFGVRIALFLGIVCLLAGCTESGKRDKLAFGEVVLSSEPAAPHAKQDTKLTVTVNNADYAARDAEVQLQINAKSALPKLIDTVKEGDAYTASYSFPSADDYTITVHMSYEDEHFSFAKPLKVEE
ncbi:hypothetical protein [Cohnella nanjingensis]|uniref:YtkA-like domain-containing protein n=1 Tax=Cohnella nanjingensis TaxID=1387779 RepID=A0A7X0VIE9_9BACL|nr:hypothetical protein [Cohnella nanjingensis]MBB6673599.1 hypothetical protein [Cohnella nanjingensis]